MPVISGGEQVVSSFGEVEIGSTKYLFLLVDKTQDEEDRDELLSRSLRRFGRDLGPVGWIVHTYASPQLDPFREVVGKPWQNESLVERMRQTQQPFLLVISSDFEKFDPREDRWQIIWLEDYDRNQLGDVFRWLAQAVQLGRDTGEDIYDYIEHRLRRDASALVSRGEDNGIALPAATLIAIPS